MLQHVIKQWDANKHNLEEYFKITNLSEIEYESIVRKIFELVVINDEEGWNKYDPSKMVVVDHGDYQGTQIFLIPTDTYQPMVGDYIITHNEYGSCSGCDTLDGITCYDSGKPNESQLKKLMTLALHLVQKMTIINSTEE
jgi:hypothetical protein